MRRLQLCGVAGMLAVGIVSGIWMASPTPVVRAADEPAEHHHDHMMPKGEVLATKDISSDQAHAALMSAMKKAQELKVNMDIAVVDAGGNLKAFMRMDGAWLGSIDIAMKKAKTARYFDMNTGDIGKLSQPGQPLYQIEVSNGGLITFPGGVPLKSGDTVIGAIGVSGSSVENDHAVASAGAEALK
ncbi:MAG TPA: heme-binding protein [Tepidisphaeraceae bacterium]